MSLCCCPAPAIARSVLAIVIALAVPGLLVHGLLPGLPPMAFIATASTAFVLIALLSGGLRSASGALMVAGLVGCLMGDVLGARGSFIASVAAFLTAHLLFIAAYVLRRGDLRRGLAVSLLFAALSAMVMTGIYGRANGAERAIAVAYAVVISAMVGAAASTAHLRGGRLILVAAVVFYVSDIAVAYWKFVGGDFPYAWGCYPLYYTACTMLAFGAGMVGEERAGEVDGNHGDTESTEPARSTAEE